MFLVLGLAACMMSEDDSAVHTGETDTDTDTDVGATDSAEHVDDTGVPVDTDDGLAEAQFQALYDLATVQDFRIELSDAAIQSLDHSPFEYVEGNVEFAGQRFEQVGIRLKGSSTFQDWSGKPAFKIHLDEYVPDVRYAGKERFTLNNMTGDPAMAREVIGYRLWADAGMKVPRANYARVYVNAEFYGLYVNIEAMDERWLNRRYDDDEGDLWEGNDYSDFTMPGVQNFELVCGVGVVDELNEVSRQISQSGPNFYEDLDDVVDMDSFLDFWAWSIAIGNRDGYPYNQNDFFVYDDPSDGRIDFSPWGMDESFDTATPYYWDYVSGALAVYCLDDEDCVAKLYLAAGEALAFYEGYDVLGLADQVYALSAPVLIDDPRMPWTPLSVDQYREVLTIRLEAQPARIHAAMGI
jgi:hypothetical protein